MEQLLSELEKMKIAYQFVHIIQQEDGVVVARVLCENRSFIIKLFLNQEFCREIENYKLLSALHIPTLHVEAATDHALLLQDIDDSAYRLGNRKDLNDPATAVLIAKWYKKLHCEGYQYIEQNNVVSLYDENDVITLENIEEIKRKTDTSKLPVWSLIENHFDSIKRILDGTKRTLTYNDFYYTNLVVSKDGTSAMMFDYNLLGKGYAYADIRNVCSSLSQEAGKAFREAYGEFSAAEAALDDVVSVLTCLHFACQKEQFPDWAKDSLANLNSILYSEKIFSILGLE